MKKYNRDKRASYNAHIKNMHTYDTCNANDKYRRIHINVHYDGYNHTEYVKIIHGKTRDTHAQTYVNVTNAIRDIFPELDKEHTAHTYRATSPYRKHPPEYIYREIPRYMKDEEHITKDTHTVKCIIMNDDEDIIYIGMMRRTRTVNMTRHTIDITLHKGTRTMQAYERAVDLDRIIHGMTVREIRAHDVEIYYI